MSVSRSALVVLAVIVIAAAVPVHAEMTCYWNVIDVAYITTWGFYYHEGSIVWVPMGTSVYYYWGYECYEIIDVHPDP